MGGLQHSELNAGGKHAAAKHVYAVVTPVRNEVDVLQRTIDSMAEQTEQPRIWLVVDDGSSDGTAQLVEDASSRVPFLRLLRLEESGRDQDRDRLKWAAEAIAFNAGLGTLDLDLIDFVVKLDGDLAFGPEFFASLFLEFDADPSLGIAGGTLYDLIGEKRVLEWVPEAHVRGATKVYRKECFAEIGGIEPVYGWDTLDELRAQMAGWRTRSFASPADHLRPTGSRGGSLRGIARMGRGAYLLGYHPAFLVARSVRLMTARPYIVGGLSLLAGYVGACVERPKRSASAETIAYLRSQQMDRLKGLGDMVELRSLLGRDRQ